MRSVATGFFISLIFLMMFAVSAFFVQSQTITITQSGVGYELPYPGILPDHPLYILKAIRDRLTDFLTRDYYKKSQLYLLYADKRLVMSSLLLKKGKTKLALTTLSKAEKYFDKIPSLVVESQKQGAAFPKEFIARLKLANAKHTEVIGDMIKQLPQGEEGAINEILQINSRTKAALNRF